MRLENCSKCFETLIKIFSAQYGQDIELTENEIDNLEEHYEDIFVFIACYSISLGYDNKNYLFLTDLLNKLDNKELHNPNDMDKLLKYSRNAVCHGGVTFDDEKVYVRIKEVQLEYDKNIFIELMTNIYNMGITYIFPENELIEKENSNHLQSYEEIYEFYIKNNGLQYMWDSTIEDNRQLEEIILIFNSIDFSDINSLEDLQKRFNEIASGKGLDINKIEIFESNQAIEKIKNYIKIIGEARFFSLSRKKQDFVINCILNDSVPIMAIMLIQKIIDIVEYLKKENYAVNLSKLKNGSINEKYKTISQVNAAFSENNLEEMDIFNNLMFLKIFEAYQLFSINYLKARALDEGLQVNFDDVSSEDIGAYYQLFQDGKDEIEADITSCDNEITRLNISIDIVSHKRANIERQKANEKIPPDKRKTLTTQWNEKLKEYDEILCKYRATLEKLQNKKAYLFSRMSPSTGGIIPKEICFRCLRNSITHNTFEYLFHNQEEGKSIVDCYTKYVSTNEKEYFESTIKISRMLELINGLSQSLLNQFKNDSKTHSTRKPLKRAILQSREDEIYEWKVLEGEPSLDEQ